MIGACFRFAAASGFVLAAAGCSSSGESLDLEITPGLEKDAFTASPKVTEVDVTVTNLDGKKVTAKSKPGGTFDLGDVTPTDAISIDVVGKTASGEVVMQGLSLAVAPAAIDGDLFPVFCQRVNAWARPPDALPVTHVGGVAAIVSERFLLLTGGSKAVAADGSKAATTEGEFYDFGTLSGTNAADPLPLSASTAIGLGDTSLLIGDHGASWVSFVDGTTASASTPSGLDSYADVAGGRPFTSPAGDVYVIGATRGAGSTASVLTISITTDTSDGSATAELGATALSHPRVGAAVGWVEGVGLVVAGGASGAPGVEVMRDGSTTFSTRAFPDDPITGAGLGSAGSGVYLIGGVDKMGGAAPTRRIEPTCASKCAALEDKPLTLPVALIDVQVFRLDDSRLLAVGSEAKAGHARAFEIDIDDKKVIDIPLREARIGATFAATPYGTLAVMGGLHDDGSPAVHVETLFPR